MIGVEDAFNKYMPWTEFNGQRVLWLGMLEVFKAGWDAHKQSEDK